MASLYFLAPQDFTPRDVASLLVVFTVTAALLFWAVLLPAWSRLRLGISPWLAGAALMGLPAAGMAAALYLLKNNVSAVEALMVAACLAAGGAAGGAVLGREV
jgi:hypothetical protein